MNQLRHDERRYFHLMGKQNHGIHCTKIEGLAGAQGLMRHSLLHKQLELLDWQRECLQGLLKRQFIIHP